MKEELEASILKALRGDMAQILRTEEANIKVTMPFLEMGADSIVLVEAIQRIESQFRVKLTIGQMFEEFTNLTLIARHVADNMEPDSAWARAQRTAEEPHAAPEIIATRQPEQQKQTEEPVERQGLTQILIDQNRVLAEVMTQQLALLRHGAGTPQAPEKQTRQAKPVPKPQPSAKKPAAGVTKGAPKPAGAMPWGNAAEVRARGLDERQRVHLEALSEAYIKRTSKSKELAAESRTYLADSRATVGFRLSIKEMLYPLSGDRTDGSRMWDVDGNEYIDFTMGFGVHLLGHRPPFIHEAVRKELERSVELGARSDLVGQVAKKIARMTGQDRVVFANSGTEAVMTAMRLARAATGREKIGMFINSYHGHSDGTLVRGERTEAGRRSQPMAAGVPQAIADNMLMLDYCDEASLTEIEAHAGELAAVMVEPMQSRNLELDPAAFLKRLRTLTEEHGIPLIFDEMITGFRVSPGGVQAQLGIKADLVCYGKIVGGGMPIGVVAGKKAYLDGIDGGDWTYDDATYPTVERTAFGGTFCQHPLAMAAANAMLTHLEEAGPQLQETLNRRTTQLASRLNKWFEQNQVPIRMASAGSLFRLEFQANLELLYYHMLMRGIYIWEWRSCFLSTAHTEEDVATFEKVLKESVKALKEGGYLPETCLPQITWTPPPVAMTTAQKQIWMQAEIEESSGMAYHVNTVLHLNGPFDTAAMEQAIAAVVDRHEALRTIIEGEQAQQRYIPHLDMNITQTDFTGMDARATMRWRTEIQRAPFELTKGPLFRAHLARITTTEHLVSLSAHHINTDGWTMGLIAGEIAQIYTAKLENRALTMEQPMQYSRYVALREKEKTSRDMQSHREWWHSLYADGIPILDLPTDRPRSKWKTYHGGKTSRKTEETLTTQIRSLAQQHGCTPFMVLFTACGLLIQRLTRQDDFILGVPVNGRPYPNSTGLAGYCTHVMPVRYKPPPGLTFSGLLAYSRKRMLDSYEHQHYPFAELLASLDHKRDMYATPMVNLVFNMEPKLAAPKLPGLRVELLENPIEFAIFDLSLNVFDQDDQLLIDCDYNKGLFETDTVRRWLTCYTSLLQEACEKPSYPTELLPLLRPEAAQRILYGFNETTTAFPATTGVHHLIEREASKVGEREALLTSNEGAEQRTTYADLNARANRQAHQLKEQGVQPETIVALSMTRGLEMVTSLLAILKAGGAYLPLDPETPKERMSYMLQDARAHTLIVDAATKASQKEKLAQIQTRVYCPEQEDSQAGESTNPNINPLPNHAFNVIYTSGSTGRPKGVTVAHSSVVNLVHWAQETFTQKELSGVFATTSLSFDVSVFELLAPLSAGGRVIMAENVLQLPHHPQRDEIRLISTVPSAMVELCRAGAIPQTICTICLAGEALTHRLVRNLYSSTKVEKVYNFYGPTEDTVFAAGVLLEREEPAPIPIGHALPNHRLYVLDANQQPRPLGIPGELYLAGAGLARGYLGRPRNTAQRFIPDPFIPNSRLYRTGDLVRHIPRTDEAAPMVQFLGRIDYQVKVRGYRIELGEIEANLAECPGIAEAVVIVREDHQLQAYVVGEEAGGSRRLRTHLKTRLPEYMIPQLYEWLPELPSLPNGKLDRKSLPRTEIRHGSEPPTNPLEAALVEIWRTLLKVEVGTDDHFFRLGGHSLTATAMLTQVREQLGIKVSLSAAFANPVLRDLAQYMSARRPHAYEAIPMIEPRATYPVTPIQKQLLIRDRYRDGGNAVPAVYEIKGQLDETLLKETLTTLLERHEILRTVFSDEDGQLSQRVLTAVNYPFAMQQRDYSKEPDPEAALNAQLQKEAANPLDTANGPLWRVCHVKLADNHQALVWTMHHTINDGWSIMVLMQEFTQYYDMHARKTKPTMPDLPFTYKDYAVWLEAQLANEGLAEVQQYWREHLAGANHQLALPLDNPRTRQGTHLPASQRFEIPATVMTALRATIQGRGATLFVGLFAALKILLYRHTGQGDITVGTPVAGRGYPGMQRQIGPYLNILPLRDRLTGETRYEELLEAVLETTLNGLAHQIYPSSKMVEALPTEPGRNPLFDVGFTLQNQEDLSTPQYIAGNQISERDMGKNGPANTEANTDLWYLARETSTGKLAVELVYNAHLYREETIQTLVKDYQKIVQTVALEPQIQARDILLTQNQEQEASTVVAIELEM